MVRNYQALERQVTMAKHDPEMRSGISERFAMGFRKFSFELAQRDPLFYYSLEYFERYFVERLYADMDHILTGRFADEEVQLRAADYTSYSFLADIKNRHFSRRLIFRVSPDWLRKHLRERLPDVPYTDIKPPGLLKRLRRRFN
jgi:hypothetical protein